MNTDKTRTEADNSGTSTKGSIKKAERRKDLVYKGDRVDVWATGANTKTPVGTKKSMHPILAEKLVEKGYYSYEELATEVTEKKKKKVKGE